MASDWKALAGNLIETYEGFRSRPYRDLTGRWTTGFGTTVLPDGSPVTEHTPPVSLAIARNYYAAQLQPIADAITGNTEQQLNTGQLAALVDFAYNLGVEALLGSHLFKYADAGDFGAASKEFEKWDHAHVNGEVVELPGLKKRRLAEAALFSRGY